MTMHIAPTHSICEGVASDQVSCAGDWAPYWHMLEELQARADKDAKQDKAAAPTKKATEPKDKKRRCASLSAISSRIRNIVLSTESLLVFGVIPGRPLSAACLSLFTLWAVHVLPGTKRAFPCMPLGP